MTPYYSDDLVTIYHGDCREWIAETLCNHFPGQTECDWCRGQRADVLITDPPYGVNLGTHSSAPETRLHNALAKAAYASYEDTPENFDAVVVPVIRTVLSRVDRGLVFCAGHMAWRLPVPTAVGGVYLPAAVGRTAWGYNSFVHCLMYGAAPDLHKGAKPIGIRSTANAEGMGHPAAKPMEWMRWAVDLASRAGETVFDPFMGSGTTLAAAKDMGRKAIGIEIEERYCEIAARRCQQDVLGLSFSPPTADTTADQLELDTHDAA